MIKLKVTGMTCGHCEAAVKKALGQVPGVERVVSVDRTRQETMVDEQPEVGALILAIQEKNYQAEVSA